MHVRPSMRQALFYRPSDCRSCRSSDNYAGTGIADRRTTMRALGSRQKLTWDRVSRRSKAAVPSGCTVTMYGAYLGGESAGATPCAGRLEPQRNLAIITCIAAQYVSRKTCACSLVAGGNKQSGKRHSYDPIMRPNAYWQVQTTQLRVAGTPLE